MMKKLKNFLLVLIASFSVLSGCAELDLALEVTDNIVSEYSNNNTPRVMIAKDHASQMEVLSRIEATGDDYMHVDLMTISMDDWDGEQILFGGQDTLGRTLPAEAHLSARNVGRSDGRESQTYTPSGWNQKQLEIDGSSIWLKNRGHLIAYTLSFNFDDEGNFIEGYPGSENNPINLFTQTQHSNQRVMTKFEDAIRDALANGSKVVYSASPIFRDDELMARGIWLQGLSDDDDVAFSVYIFNYQPGVFIDYSTGANWLK